MRSVGTNRTVILFLQLAVSIVVSVDRMAMSMLVVPIKEDFGLTDAEVGFLLGPAFVILYVIFGVLFGMWADRGNRRNIIAGAIALPPTEATELPFTITTGSPDGYLDVNDDGTYDFQVYASNGCSGLSYVVRMSGNNASSIDELASPDVKSLQQTWQYCTIFSLGDEINSSFSFTSSVNVYDWDENNPSDLRQDTYIDGIREGYIGVRINSGSIPKVDLIIKIKEKITFFNALTL